jgi:hypothetical protein
MTTPTVPTKTALGLDELRHRTRGLSQRHRTVLLLVDGKRPLGELLNLAQQAGSTASHFEELVRLGLVEVPLLAAAPVVDAVAELTPAAAQVTAVELPVPAPEVAAAAPQPVAAVPETAATVPEAEAAVTETASAVPEAVAAVPEAVASVPEAVGGVPEAVASVPEVVAEVPEAVAAAPEAVAAPEAGPSRADEVFAETPSFRDESGETLVAVPAVESPPAPEPGVLGVDAPGAQPIAARVQQVQETLPDVAPVHERADETGCGSVAADPQQRLSETGFAAEPSARAQDLEAPRDDLLEETRELLIETLRVDGGFSRVRLIPRVHAANSLAELIDLVWVVERSISRMQRSKEGQRILEQARDLLGLGNTQVTEDTQLDRLE